MFSVFCLVYAELAANFLIFAAQRLPERLSKDEGAVAAGAAAVSRWQGMGHWLLFVRGLSRCRQQGFRGQEAAGKKKKRTVVEVCQLQLGS